MVKLMPVPPLVAKSEEQQVVGISKAHLLLLSTNESDPMNAIILLNKLHETFLHNTGT